MTFEQAEIEVIRLFGEDNFMEHDEEEGKYYIGEMPREAGAYTGYMGYSWEEAILFATKDKGEK